MNTPARFREAIMSLVGAPTALYQGRVYAKVVPQDTLDKVWLCIDRIGSQRVAAHDGDGKMSETQFQLTVGGGKRDEVEEVKDFLIEGLNGLEYAASEGSIAILLAGDQDVFDADSKAYTALLDFTVMDNNT